MDDTANLFFFYLQDNDHEYILCISYFEIVNEVIHDLLVEQSTGLKISDENKRVSFYFFLLNLV